MIGTWLPWLTNDSGSVTGLGSATGNASASGGFGPGNLVLVLAAVTVLVGALRARMKSPLVTSVIALVVSVVALLLTFVYYGVNVDDRFFAGAGLYLSIVGLVVAVVASVWAIIKRA